MKIQPWAKVLFATSVLLGATIANAQDDAKSAEKAPVEKAKKVNKKAENKAAEAKAAETKAADAKAADVKATAAAPGQGATVLITARGVKVESGGTIYASMYCGEEGWLKDSAAFAHSEAKVTGPDVTVKFEKVTAPSCAINMYHDQNSNGKLDFTGGMISVPDEGVAVSNNATRMGPPRYKKAEFKIVAPETKQDVKMNY